MTTEPNLWAALIEAANARVTAAQRGERNAALEVVTQSAIALRGISKNGEMPDPMRMVYLRALLGSLEEIEKGADPVGALHLRPAGRVRDEKLFCRYLLLFVQTGQALDHFQGERGHTRGDSPALAAQRQVVRETNHSLATVKAVWQKFGASKGWAELRELGWARA